VVEVYVVALSTIHQKNFSQASAKVYDSQTQLLNQTKVEAVGSILVLAREAK